jgi:predicted transcriptional regulator
LGGDSHLSAQSGATASGSLAKRPLCARKRKFRSSSPNIFSNAAPVFLRGNALTLNGPKVWFTSTESFAKVLSAGNRELLRVIAEKAPSSLDELARITGKAKSNLSRTLRTMEGYGLVHLERGERGRITPKVLHDRVELDLPLTLSRKAS